MDLEWIDEADGRAAADALVANHVRLVEAEVTEFVLVARWADLHDERSVTGSGSGRLLPGTERARRYGGAGTPLVGEFAAAELGCLLGRGPVAAATLMADAVDVRHRLPVLWSAVGAGRVRVWQARQVASRTRAVGLTLEQAGWVDGQTTPYLSSLPWGRFLDLVEAKIVEADPGAAEARRVAAALERFVATGQCNEFGLKTVIAKASAGDAVFFVAMCDRVAQILLLEGDTAPVGARRSKALGILANPARALALLSKYAQPTEPATASEGPAPGTTADAPHPLVPGDLHPAEDDSDDVPETRCGSCGSTPGGSGERAGDPVGDPSVFVKALASVDPERLLPAATLYVHVSRESFDAACAGGSVGVARVEGVGPVTIGQAREFLGHTRVTLKPVIDLEADHPVDAYEVPDRLREQVLLRVPADVFPWSGNVSRRRDLDHTRPYVDPGRGGPPGQSRVANLGPMSRSAHRVKTHGRGWRHHQPVPGVFLWRTPHGYWLRTDHTGTHALGKGATPDPASPAEIALSASTRPG